MSDTRKRILVLILLLLISLVATVLSAFYLRQETKTEAPRPGELIRLHVVANSDSASDQDLKRKVRDEIVRSVAPEFLATDKIASARNIARDNLERIQEIANHEIRADGKDYSVHVELACFPFPTKHYGPFILPAGDYEAVRVVIGEGGGANWWCVLFPPLCFVDMTRSAAVLDPPLNGGKVTETITPMPGTASNGGETGNDTCYGIGSGSGNNFDTGLGPTAPCPVPLLETDGSLHSGQVMPETSIQVVFSFRILEFLRSLKA